MRKNFKRLGDYIEEVKVRNSDLKAKELLGINIDKFFMPSVANIVGTDLSVYKIVKKNQFACNRMHVGRDFRLPISMSKSENEFMVSPAYDVFEIVDTEVLSPEYLMMWFSRREFDRNAWFYTDADVRGGLHWKALCDMQLPIPSIAKQLEIVKEYNVVTNRIKLNQQLIQKLEETAQTVYKQWFVDFEFPDENGLPYKSYGGEMEESELGEIPEGWMVQSFTKVLKLSGGGTPSTEFPDYWDGEIPFYTPSDLNQYYYSISTSKKISDIGLQNCSSKLFPPNTTFVTARGATVGGIAITGIPMAMNQTCYAINGNEVNDYFAHQLTLNIISKLKTEAIGATFEALVTKDFDGQIVIEPSKELVERFGEKVKSMYGNILNTVRQNQKLAELKELLLSKLATIEN